jgi:putative two-component system response regulator
MSTPGDRRPRLLLVDDEPLNLQVLRQVLNPDYRLLFATDGATALDLDRRFREELMFVVVFM